MAEAPRRPYDNVVDVDPGQLDLEWLRQPGLRKLWGDRKAEARKKLGDAEAALELAKAQAKAEQLRLEDNLEMVDARLELAVRENPTAYGLTKITDSAVRAVIVATSDHQDARRMVVNGSVELNPRYRVAKQTMLIARERHDHAEAALEACEHRRWTLHSLLKMWVGDGERDEPPLPKAGRERFDELMRLLHRPVEPAAPSVRLRAHRPPPSDNEGRGGEA